MQFSSLNDFFAMGGYAGYVWSGVGLVFTLLALLYWLSIKERKATFNQIEEKLRIEKLRRQQQNSEMTL
ncbi:heme exporter protein CcmD [Saccharobesus litoralis]|uniref:Heme exporter protein D n=1 Tax=Saccharobesus litoralis TaxID=2172099 RepID=A0A2S0VT63_9ALTE|nr:heme exporter protein CcmD [Saccharobesus litoralis]AWB67399.1 heme exporter protein CcmD [Saccharobesus litoralis]